jgi:hypothetical protein
MKMIQSTSSQVASFGYSAATKKLRVVFRSGQTYEYSDVEPDKFAEMQASESHGKFLASRVKPFHHHEKVEPIGNLPLDDSANTL